MVKLGGDSMLNCKSNANKRLVLLIVLACFILSDFIDTEQQEVLGSTLFLAGEILSTLSL